VFIQPHGSLIVRNACACRVCQSLRCNGLQHQEGVFHSTPSANLGCSGERCHVRRRIRLASASRCMMSLNPIGSSLVRCSATLGVPMSSIQVTPKYAVNQLLLDDLYQVSEELHAVQSYLMWQTQNQTAVERVDLRFVYIAFGSSTSRSNRMTRTTAQCLLPSCPRFSPRAPFPLSRSPPLLPVCGSFNLLKSSTISICSFRVVTVNRVIVFVGDHNVQLKAGRIPLALF